ncbi:MAG: xanthine dehydrogenase family protein molybdopterin-binding subunit [Treponema sp.]|nr:xanthine dehydrogenase family protein molybdopterin-binding subunit [Treponema sp.]
MDTTDYTDTFVDDIFPRNGVFSVTIRAPAAGIIRINAPKFPNTVALVSAADIRGKNAVSCYGIEDQPVFAGGRARYAGEAVGLLTAPDPVKLREWAGRVEVEITPDSGWSPRSFTREYHSGAIEEAFEKAEKIVEGRYLCHFQYPWPTDPPGAVVIPRGNGYTVITATQWPGHVRESVAAVLGINAKEVTVKPARSGTSFDSKLITPSVLACQAAAAAKRVGKAVKTVLSREEDFCYSPRRLKVEITITTAVGKGRPLGTRVSITADQGSYGHFGVELLDRIALSSLGAYNHGGVSIDARLLESALPPTGPLAGFGMAQGFFAAECHASRIADELGEDPAEWRKNVFLHRGKKFAIGTEIKDNAPLAELIDAVSSMSDYRRKWASYELLRRSRLEAEKDSETLRGIGISLAYQGNTLLYPPEGEKYGVEATFNKDGSVDIKTDSGCLNAFSPAKIEAAKILGVSEDKIRISGGSGINQGPACLSRNTVIVTRLIERCCTAIQKQHFRDPLPITVRRFYRNSRGLAWNKTPCDDNAFSTPGWGSAVVEVSFDPVAFIPGIRGIWLAVDGGSIIDEKRARAALTSLSRQALSGAAREKVAAPDSAALDSYLPAIDDLAAPVYLDFLWSDSAPRGIGELPFSLIPAAYTQALSQALHHPFESYPLTQREIFNALAARETGNQ